MAAQTDISRSVEAVDLRRAIAEDMRANGYTLKQIAHQLGVTKEGARGLLVVKRTAAEIVEVASKVCSACSAEKTSASFYRDNKNKDGRARRCKSCVNASISKWKVDNRERDLEKDRRRYKRHRDRLIADTLRRAVANPEKRLAHARVRQAKKHGELSPEPCSVCGSTLNVEGHHDDYEKQLEVIWLCQSHHSQRHVELRAAGRDPDEQK